MRDKLIFIIGTRPELIKTAPILIELKKRNNNNFIVINTGQHQDLLDPYWDLFHLKPDIVLSLLSKNQSLSSLTSKAILAIDKQIANLKNQGVNIKYILGQGDTTSVMAASIVAFYHNCSFVHIEAGLRSFDLQHPFPEEFNRKVTGITASMHFAPTNISKENLIKEGIEEGKIKVVGNTVVDAIKFITKEDTFQNIKFSDQRIQSLIENKEKLVLITCHRRENHNQLLNIINAVDKLAEDYKQMNFIWCLHPNPNVKEIVLKSELHKRANVIITEPLNYLELIKVLSVSLKVLTDSGGIQEEAPSFNVPVLILRETTERPEAVMAGYSILVGSSTEKIISAFKNFQPTQLHFTNPYGDGNSALRIVDYLTI
ncbi:MAG TPA: UDP-N-acetylglucosamine 2-epimerase (non-hydrolyzing) [Saprospiraceae bacterium]|nr:UDP-N-acetylglucosamine 2-epimerase (non-hydrolyzing) [Saprospiraceae bacterium]